MELQVIYRATEIGKRASRRVVKFGTRTSLQSSYECVYGMDDMAGDAAPVTESCRNGNGGVIESVLIWNQTDCFLSFTEIRVSETLVRSS